LSSNFEHGIDLGERWPRGMQDPPPTRYAPTLAPEDVVLDEAELAEFRWLAENGHLTAEEVSAILEEAIRPLDRHRVADYARAQARAHIVSLPLVEAGAASPSR
jgi:hypothetical protein